MIDLESYYLSNILWTSMFPKGDKHKNCKVYVSGYERRKDGYVLDVCHRNEDEIYYPRIDEHHDGIHGETIKTLDSLNSFSPVQGDDDVSKCHDQICRNSKFLYHFLIACNSATLSLFVVAYLIFIGRV